ncbi:G-type lectin S-receptor-like serine/threonine-protein kinase RLK1 [Gossypium hirsutum]|uniref:G-type lectin S-receptor-like serine/threonine-protein kinase RLK1 n=1 Tax=Gossypium hirsutum TaxID=3635 RepID=A0ABM3BSP0_GOSHI|nr:G-type lectin S-receptor-like serine/threonine-protein kinase RLK1 [Gossypium hirsutum]
MALGILPLISFLLLLPVWADAQTVGSVTVGAFLSADETQIHGCLPQVILPLVFTNSATTRISSCLLSGITEYQKKLLFGMQMGDRPAPRGSKLQITADRGFVLNSPQGEQLWNSETRSEAVDRGIMDDSGNFMLLGSNSILWESFKDPADTVLPSQILDKGVALSSWQSETNFSKGRFQMVLQSDGDLVLATVNLPSKHVNDPYYKIVTAGDSNSSSPGFQLIFNESGYLFVLRENEERSVLTPTITGSAKDLYYRATLDCDGVFTLYSHPKASTGNDTWTSLCGVCGFNSICSLNEDKRPSSRCPRGYALVDPSNQYGNCKPNFTLSCEEEPGPVEDLYEFEVLTNVGWPLGDYALLEPFTEDQFRQSCLHDCICAVAIFREGVKCWKKRLPLTNGRPVHSHFGAKAFLKVRKGDRPPFCPYFPNQENKNQET